MEKFFNLENIEAELFNIEYNIDLVKISLAKTESDFSLLILQTQRIEENMDALRNNGVPLIAEFKKAKEDLETAGKLLITLRNNREIFNKNLITLQDSLDKCKNRKTLALKFKESKVIQGNFGSKNGR